MILSLANLSLFSSSGFSYHAPPLGHNFFWELLRYNLKPVPKAEGKERLKKKADHSRLVGGKFNKQGNYETFLGQLQDE